MTHPLVIRAAALLAALSLVAAPAHAAAGRPVAHRAAPHAVAPRAAASAPSLPLLAKQARAHVDAGDYVAAATALRALRARTAPDADLELELALSEARSGQLDSAWTRLNDRLLAGALADSANPAQWHEYLPGREKQWLDGRFGGWYWYVARARAEVALALGRWDEATSAARIAARALPMMGHEHLLLAVAAGRAGDLATARAEAARAELLDPLLPEAHYLAGLWAWRDGDRAGARAAFERACAGDSAWSTPALARVRLTLPGSRPDSLPTFFLVGARRAGALIEPARPKSEDTPLFDTLPGLWGGEPTFAVPDSLAKRMGLEKPLHFQVSVLVDARGRLALVDLPFLTEKLMPASLLHDVLALGDRWRFSPATRLGLPVAAWANVEIVLNP